MCFADFACCFWPVGVFGFKDEQDILVMTILRPEEWGPGRRRGERGLLDGLGRGGLLERSSRPSAAQAARWGLL